MKLKLPGSARRETESRTNLTTKGVVEETNRRILPANREYTLLLAILMRYYLSFPENWDNISKKDRRAMIPIFRASDILIGEK